MRRFTLSSLLAIGFPAIAQTPAPPEHRLASPPTEPRGQSQIPLNEDDKPAFPPPPDGWDKKREKEDTPHGKLEMIEYDSKTIGTKRRMNIYTPPGYAEAANASFPSAEHPCPSAPSAVSFFLPGLPSFP